MVESFKITAQNLKRYLKVSVHLPDNYYKTDYKYPTVISFDGQLLFNFLTEHTKEIDIDKSMEKSRAICIGIQAPTIPAWRLSELNPYYNGADKQVDTVLSYIFYDYIINELIPLLKIKYRMSEDLFLLGFNEGAISAIYMMYKYDIFTGAGIFYPTLNEVDNKFYQDIEKHFKKEKQIFMYQGSNDGTPSKFYDLYIRFKALGCEKIEIIFSEQYDNSYKAFETNLIEFFRFIEDK